MRRIGRVMLALMLALALFPAVATAQQSVADKLASAGKDLESGRFQQVIDLLSTISQVDDAAQLTTRHLYMGLAYAGLGKDDHALRSFSLALSIDQNATIEERFATKRTVNLLKQAKESLNTLDKKAPVIKVSPLGTAFVGEPFEIRATVTDDVQVGQVLLYYRTLKTGPFTLVDMKQISMGQYYGLIPGKEVGETGIQFYILATDNTNRAPTLFHSEENPFQISIISGVGSRMDEAVLKMEMRHYEEALPILHEIVKEAEKAAAQNLEGSEDQAVALVSADPAIIKAYMLLAACFLELDKEQAAYQAVRSAVRLNRNTIPDYRFTSTEIKDMLADARDELRNVDLTPPDIIPLPIPYATRDQVLEIGAKVIDDLAVTRVTLYYRTTGDQGYERLEMMEMAPHLYFAHVPENEVSEDGLQIYFEAVDASGQAPATYGSADQPLDVFVH